MEKNIITPQHKRITIQQMVTQIQQYMSKRPLSKIIVGADSQKVKGKFCFATAICCIDPGNGGIFYIKKQYRNPHRDMNVKSQISYKVWQQAQDICQMMKTLSQYNVQLNQKITHHDISSAGLSRDHIQSIMGFMKSQGFSPQIKPNAIIASGIANHYSKK